MSECHTRVPVSLAVSQGMPCLIKFFILLKYKIKIPNGWVERWTHRSNNPPLQSALPILTRRRRPVAGQRRLIWMKRQWPDTTTRRDEFFVQAHTNTSSVGLRLGLHFKIWKGGYPPKIQTLFISLSNDKSEVYNVTGANCISIYMVYEMDRAHCQIEEIITHDVTRNPIVLSYIHPAKLQISLIHM